MNIINIKNNLNDERVLAIVSLSQYMPTTENLKSLAHKYESDSTISAFACVDDGIVCGIIILKRIVYNEFEIIGIATDHNHRKKGVASKLISYATNILNCSIITAETDDDAVDFYRKYGFKIKSLGEKYPGIVRYLCTLKLR